MNIHTVAVLFVIGCTPPSVFSSDVAGRHRQALQSKKDSGGGNSDNHSLSTAINRCIDGFTGTYTYASDCNGVAFMASLGCTKGICDYSESQFADVTVCPDSEIRQPSKCVLSGSFDATEYIDPQTCEVKVFKVSGDENCNFQEFATTPTGIRINRNEFNEISIYFERMDNAPKVLLSSPKDDVNTRRLEQNFVGVLYSKSVDDHHRYLASGDITTGDKMKVLDVHRRRLQCSGDCSHRRCCSTHPLSCCGTSKYNSPLCLACSVNMPVADYCTKGRESCPSWDKFWCETISPNCDDYIGLDPSIGNEEESSADGEDKEEEDDSCNDGLICCQTTNWPSCLGCNYGMTGDDFCRMGRAEGHPYFLDNIAPNCDRDFGPDPKICKDDPLFRFVKKNGCKTNKTCDMMNSKKCKKKQGGKKIHKYCPMTCGTCGTEEDDDDGPCEDKEEQCMQRMGRI